MSINSSNEKTYSEKEMLSNTNVIDIRGRKSSHGTKYGVSRKFQWLENAVMASWWLEWEDLEWPCPNIEKKWQKRAQIFTKAGINTAVIFGFHFRWDYLPIMERVIKILARITNICHSHGIKVVDHHSALFVHRARNDNDRHEIREKNRHHVPFYPDSWDNLYYNGYEMHEWLQISATNNKPAYIERYTAQAFCMNNPNFQQSYRNLIERHLEEINYDALMSDDLEFMPDVYSCVCQHCRARFKDETGLEIPDVSNSDFWENRNNEKFQLWLHKRYQWSAEHYKRVRSFLRDDVALWGCSSHCMHPFNSNYGFAPHLFSQHCDAVHFEVFHKNQVNSDSQKYIKAEMSGFKTLSQIYEKPLIALFYVNQPQDIQSWFNLIEQWNVRPWISKQVRIENAVREEQLLENGFSFMPEHIEAPAAAVRYSMITRDKLSDNQKMNYYDCCVNTVNDLIDKGFKVYIQFDGTDMDDLDVQEFWDITSVLDDFVCTKRE